MAAATSVHVVAIIEPIIQHADWFFPEGKTSVCLICKVFFFKGFKDLYLLIPQLQLYLSNLLFIPHIIFTISSPFVSNHLSSRGGIQRFGHVRLALPPATPDPEPSLDRKRPGSLVGQDGDSHTPRKDRYLSRPNLSLSLPLTLPSRPKTLSRQESRGPAVSALYVVANESITVTETPTEDLPSPDFKAVP